MPTCRLRPMPAPNCCGGWSMAPLVPATPRPGSFREERLAELRRDRVVRPAIFVGAGTCGLGAGAKATLDCHPRVPRHPRNQRRRGQGRLHRPVLGRTDRRHPVARPRAGLLPTGHGRQGAGDFSTQSLPAACRKRWCSASIASATLTPWDDVPYLDEHPFFAPQTRWVLANCGLIDPAQIDEYIARGGYAALVEDASRTDARRKSATWSKRAGCAAAAAAASPPARSGSSPGSRPGRPEVPDLQRRRRRSRRVHGPGRDRERSAPPARGHGHRRLRHRRDEGLRLHPRRVSAGHQAAQGGHRPGRSRRPAGRQHPRQRLQPATSSSRWAPGRSSAAKRPR